MSTWVRIDDRLLHAQVLLGWAPCLAPRRIVLANDRVAADTGLGDMYRSLSEGEYGIDVLDVATAAQQFRDPAGRDRTLFVLESVQDARRLLEEGAPLELVVLGGLHESPGARRLANVPVFLTQQDARDLLALLERGVQVQARDVPTAAAVGVDAEMLAAVWP